MSMEDWNDWEDDLLENDQSSELNDDQYDETYQ